MPTVESQHRSNSCTQGPAKRPSSLRTVDSAFMSVVIFSMDFLPHPYGMARGVPAVRSKFICITRCCFAKLFAVRIIDTSHRRWCSADIPALAEPSAGDERPDHRVGCQD